jgi:thioesterase domain-containing protein
MAATYVEQLRERQPRGPYLLGGWSLGGMVAWEMARQLEERGEHVSLLVLLDTWALPQAVDEPDELDLLADFALHLGIPVSGLDVTAGDLAGLDTGERLDFLLEKARLAGVVPADLGPHRIRNLFQVFSANAEANRRYAPAPAEVPVQLWRAAESLATAAEPSLGWTALARGGLEVHDVPGDHFSIVREPQIETVARRLSECLRAFEEVNA